LTDDKLGTENLSGVTPHDDGGDYRKKKTRMLVKVYSKLKESRNRKDMEAKFSFIGIFRNTH